MVGPHTILSPTSLLFSFSTCLWPSLLLPVVVYFTSRAKQAALRRRDTVVFDTAEETLGLPWHGQSDPSVASPTPHLLPVESVCMNLGVRTGARIQHRTSVFLGTHLWACSLLGSRKRVCTGTYWSHGSFRDSTGLDRTRVIWMWPFLPASSLTW